MLKTFQHGNAGFLASRGRRGCLRGENSKWHIGIISRPYRRMWPCIADSGREANARIGAQSKPKAMKSNSILSSSVWQGIASNFARLYWHLRRRGEGNGGIMKSKRREAPSSCVEAASNRRARNHRNQPLDGEMHESQSSAGRHGENGS